MSLLEAPAFTGARLLVDLDAVAANTRTLAASTRAAVMAVVKADGFGHGAAAMARTALAAGASSLGVTSIAEAFELRAAGITAPILSWLNPVGADFSEAVAAGIELAVPSLAHLAAMPAGAHIHLHLDTGMARDGAEPHAWAALCQAARQADVQVAGVMSHLGCADSPADPANAAALAAFEGGVAVARRAGLRPRVRHLAATAATLTAPATHFDLVRVGAGLAGIDPSGTVALRGALTLKAPIVSVRRVRAGTPVGYGHTWHAPCDTSLGLLPVGYADGLPRLAGAGAQVQVRGHRQPVAGRISMDQTVVDLGDLPVAAGECVTVFGPGDGGEPTVADWARWAATIPHEIVTGLGSRLSRHTVGGAEL
ncbi:alanine racemase [Actinoplanes sp. TFC3]|uniref:alanine racemase n=1 Tax=Actinoplanes sp. TFC3 TaxID=1710355 RepID=UPI00082CD05E|nr:alanine racemase [Actinoplanes sp. TFC3]